MSRDLNLCQFIGRLGRDPETKDNAITNISIAVGWKTKEKEGTEWVPVVFFGKLAEIAAQYLRKGSQVYIAGRYQTRSWEKDGQKHYRTEIVAETMQMLGGKRTTEEAPSSRESSASGAGDPNDPIPFAPIQGIA